MLEIQMPKSVHAFSANTYVIFSGEECAVIDPTVQYSKERFAKKVKYVLLTHSHFDHILEIDSWAASGAEVIISEKELTALSDPYRNCYKLFYGEERGYFGKARGVSEGDILPFGDTEITVMELPGHTVGSVAYVCDDAVFVGDTVFDGGGFGRWDLPSGDYRTLIDSINRVLTIGDSKILYPGHGGECTVEKFKTDYKTKRIL